MAFKLIDTTANSQIGATGREENMPAPSDPTGYTLASRMYTVLDESGLFNVDVLDIPDNANFNVYQRQPNGSYSLTNIGGGFIGQFAGYIFGGMPTITSAGVTTIWKAPVAIGDSPVAAYNTAGVMASGTTQTHTGIAKSATKTYIIGGSTSGTTALTTTQIYPFAAGETAGTYTAPMVLPAGTKQAQVFSNIPGGSVYYSGGITSPAFFPGLTQVATTRVFPTTSDAGPVTSGGNLVTGRSWGFSFTTTTGGMVGGGVGSPATLLTTFETYPFASGTYSASPAQPLVAQKTGVGFQEVDYGYYGLGSTSAPSYTTPSPTTFVANIVRYPFASTTTTATTTFDPGISRQLARTSYSMMEYAIATGGWPGLASPVASVGTAIKFPFASQQGLTILSTLISAVTVATASQE